ncbi:MAG TPA: ribosome-associated translation inhibitor RaiA [Acidimicrobiales bacterium]
MDIRVSGRNLEVTERLKATAEDKIGRLSRFLDGMERAEVHFAEEKNPRIREKEICEVTLEGHGHHVRAKVSAADPFVAIDLVVDKLEHQLHKLKTKLLRRSHPRPNGSVDSPEGVVDTLVETEEPDNTPRIVKTKRFMIKPMAPEEAVLQMELVGHDFFFFTSSDTNRSAVVYRRRDGDVGLIDEAG